MLEKYIKVENELEIQDYINTFFKKSARLFGKCRLKRELEKLPHEKRENLYVLKFLLKDSHKGRAADRIECINEDVYHFSCGVNVVIQTYIYAYEKHIEQMRKEDEGK